MNPLRLGLGVILSLCGNYPLYTQDYGADFISGDIRIALYADKPQVEGNVIYNFRVVEEMDSIYLDVRNIDINAVRIDGTKTPFRLAAEENKLRIPSPSDSQLHSLEIDFNSIPSQTVYRVGYNDSIPGNEQIWTQGQGKYSSRWVPSFDDMREKVIFSMQIEMDSAFEVIANGALDSVAPSGGRRRWYYHMERPMSSYLLAFAAGQFQKQTGSSAGGTPLLFYLPKTTDFEITTTYRNSKEIFDYLEDQLQLSYPWQNYKQVPLQEFMYAGMENTGTTFFSDRYLTDSISIADRDYFNVNAHELAHQWFGNLVTEEDGRSHWLHEGFATYYAYKAEIEIREAESVWWHLRETAIQLELQAKQGEGKALSDPDAGSLIFYEKGAWALFALEDLLGSSDFQKGITTFLNKYAYGNANIDAFLLVMEETSGKSLDAFRSQWLDSEAFSMDWAQEYLKRKSPSLAYFFTLEDDAPKNFGKSDMSGFSEYWAAFDQPDYRANLILKFASQLTPEDYALIFESNLPKVSLAALAALGRLPAWSKDWAIGLLNASSYDLREQALFAVWNAFPEERAMILNLTRDNGSLNSETFRQLWWVLSVYTGGYATASEQMSYVKNLQESTTPGQAIDSRQNGYNLLEQLQLLGKQQHLELILATEHHSWQFRNFCRRLLDRQIDGNSDKIYWEGLLMAIPKTIANPSGLKEFEPRYFLKKLEEL